MNSFRDWYIRNQDAITWFVIGVLTMSTIDYAARGDWLWAAISTALVFANYKMLPVRIK